jgi:hypothetical protein
MVEENDKSLNGESDLEGKKIIDSNGVEIGTCKAVIVGDDGQIAFTFETEINGKKVVPSKTIPHSAIGKITDVIELRVPINIKIAQSIEELDQQKESQEIIEVEQTKEQKEIETKTEVETTKPDTTPKEQITPIETDKAETEVNVEMPIEPEKLVGSASIESHQADATEQLSKALIEEDEEAEEVIEEQPTEVQSVEASYKVPIIRDLMIGLEEAVSKIEQLFKLASEGNADEKIEAVRALTKLTKISPELGLSLIPKMLILSDEQQQNVRLAIAQELEAIGESNPDLFKNYFLEVLENVYDEPIEEIREHLAKTLHYIAMKEPEIASQGLEEYLEEVIIGKRVPEVPSKVIHDATLKVVSGHFLLTRIAIRVRLKFIMKGGKLADRSVEELEDYNATLIGLTIIETFDIKEAEKLIKKPAFKKLGTIFVEVIQQMIEAYKEGSFSLLESVVDKKIEIPTSIIERFYEIRIEKTLMGVKNVPMEVFLENPLIEEEEAEQIVYRLIVQKRVNAAITMSNGKTFITAFDTEESEKPKTTKKPAPKKTTAKKTTTPKKTTTTAKKTTSISKTTTTKKTPAKTTAKKTTTAKKPSTTKKTTATKKE